MAFKFIRLPLEKTDILKIIRFFRSREEVLDVRLGDVVDYINSQTAALALDDLTDVDAPSPSNGQALIYNSSTNEWEPGSISGGGPLLNEPTGILFGGDLSASIGGTTFDLTAGIGQIVTQTSTISGVSTTVTSVSWAAATAVPITNIATSPFTYVLIDNTGTIIQQTTPFTDAQYKTHIVIGIVCHIDLATVNLVTNTQNVAYQDPYRLVELIRLFGPIKKTGMVIKANGANLRVDRTAGQVFKIGSNYTTAAFEPDVDTISAATPAQLCRVHRDGSGGFVFDTFGGLYYPDIDPQQWDDGSGTLQGVPSNRWTIQRLFMFPNNPNDIICYYGIQLYNNFSEARAGVEFETFDEAQITAENAVFLGYLFVRHNATDLSDPNEAAFLQAGLFRGIPPGGGGSGGGGVTSVGLSVPSPSSPAFSVTGSPVTTSGTLQINALGTTSQYVRGDGSLATLPAIPSPTAVFPYIKRKYHSNGDFRAMSYYGDKLFIAYNSTNIIRVFDTQTGLLLVNTSVSLPNTCQIIDDIATPENWSTATASPPNITRHNASTGAFIASTPITGAITSAQQSRYASFSATKTIGANTANIYTIDPSTFVTANLTAHGLGSGFMTYLAINKNVSSLQNGVCMVGGPNGICLFDCNTNTLTLAATNLSGALGAVLDVAYDPVNDFWLVANLNAGVLQVTALQPVSSTTFTIVYNITDVTSADFTLTGGNAKQISLVPIGNIGQLYVCVNSRFFIYSLITGGALKSDYVDSLAPGATRATYGVLDEPNKRMFFATGALTNELIYAE